MRSLRAWCCAALLALSGGVQAELRLVLEHDQLSAAERQASQALLDDALAALPPSFVQRLARSVKVAWRDDLPANAYGQASLVSELDLNPVIAYPDGYAVVDARIITNRSIMSS